MKIKKPMNYNRATSSARKAKGLNVDNTKTTLDTTLLYAYKAKLKRDNKKS